MNNLESLTLFGETIYAAKLDIDESIIPKILKLPDTTKTEHKSNEGGWQSPLLKTESIDYLKPLIQSCRVISEPLFDEYGIENCDAFTYWININYPGNYNVRHRHEGFMSGCVYIKVPENSGDLLLHRHSLFNAKYKHLTKHTYPTHDIKPETGLLLLFPMYLDHEVTVNNSNDTRISIAFNFY